MNNQRGRESLFARAVEEAELPLGLQVGGEREGKPTETSHRHLKKLSLLSEA